MNRYDEIVVGSGASGLTASVLFALAGHRVLLLEQAPHIGGSLARFRCGGVPFDTGFHFTGGFAPNGILLDMLQVLGIRDAIRPRFLRGECANRFVFEAEDRAYDFPAGLDALRRRLKDYFPGDAQAVDRFVERVERVCRETTACDIRRIAESPPAVDEDGISLQQVLDSLTGNATLKAMLSGFCMCYGVKPSEVSFANHSRMCLNMYESVARVDGGGDAFVQAFRGRLAELGVEVRCSTTVAACADVSERQVGRFVLSDGTEVAADACLFTIHPKSILGILPREHVSRAFAERVADFEPSAGFFALFAVLDPPAADDGFGASVTSLFPCSDVNRLLDPAGGGDSALVVFTGFEPADGRPVPVLTAFEPAFAEQVSAWAGSRVGRRPAAYEQYKQRRIERIRARIAARWPAYGDRLRTLAAASPLTFRDYLHSPDGSAYGVKQKIGQHNVVGRLPLRNLHAAGQSAILPGVVGAMVSSFFAARGILGKEPLNRLVGRALEHR